jgi:hypothetical protein
MTNRNKLFVSLFAAILGGLVGIKHLFLWNWLCYYRVPAEICAAYYDETLYVATALLSGLLVFFAVFYAIGGLFRFYKTNCHTSNPMNA